MTSSPTSLHALIAARIDGLGDVERSLLMSAAVLGRRFTTAALAAVSEADSEASSRSVEILLRQEMLTRDRDVRTGAVGQLAFQEQLVRRGLPEPLPAPSGSAGTCAQRTTLRA